MHLFERRIFFSVLGVILSFIPIIFATFFALHKIIEEQKNLMTVNATQVFEAEKLLYINSTLMSIMPAYVLSGDPTLLTSFDHQFQSFNSVRTELSASEAGPEFQEILQKIQSLSEQIKDLTGPGITLRKNGAPISQVNDYFVQNTKPLSNELQELLKQLSTMESQELSTAEHHFLQTVDWVVGFLLLFLCMTLALVFFIGRLVVKTLNQKKAYDESQITLLKREQELSQARKDAVEVVAHDLKNPIGTVKMSIEMMLDEITTAESALDLRTGLEIAYRSVESMERLTKDLLDHAKIEAGHLVLEKKDCDLTQLVKDLVLRFTPLAKNKNILLLSEIDENAFMVHCDYGRIEQVLLNLLGNALKFTPEKGQIKITLSNKESDVFIAVEDTGPGIEKDQLEKIFSRFWQAKETAKLGNGLGLFIAKSIVEAHGGQIWAESVKGQGSKFFVLLPEVFADKALYPKDNSASRDHEASV